VVGLESLILVNQQDLKKLNEMLENTNGQIERLDKFKDECGATVCLCHTSET
jgi:hypothetical protein